MSEQSSAKPGASTFLVRIQFRENTSWQGRIEWLEGKKSQSFRSLLELLMLMQEAQETADSGENTLNFHSWNKKQEVS